MLLQVSVENFLSFKERTTFSMLALEDSAAQAHQVCEVDGLKVLRCAALYGANASGKSNFIKAISFAQWLVSRGPREKEELLETRPFRLDETTAAAPSLFEFHLLLGRVHYSYGFKITATRVLAEWLDRVEADGTVVSLFTRMADEGTPDLSHFDLNKSVVGSPERQQFFEFLATGTPPNRLFLTESVQRNAAEFTEIYNWFRYGSFLVLPTAPYGGLAGRLAFDEPFRRYVASYVGKADTGIRSLDVAIEPAPEDLEGGMSARTASQDFEAGRKVRVGRSDGTYLVQVKSLHASQTGPGVPFGMDEESDGTRRLMNLLPILYESSVANVKLAFIDELDRSLHPLMTQQFVRDFLESTTSDSQLIFTTHDTNLLSRQLLPAEAVWFIQKEANGASQAYSLAEFDPTELEQLGANLEDGYLNGRFGAIPFFADRSKLGWDVPGQRTKNGG